jgi:hypothetical protein
MRCVPGLVSQRAIGPSKTASRFSAHERHAAAAESTRSATPTRFPSARCRSAFSKPRTKARAGSVPIQGPRVPRSRPHPSDSHPKEPPPKLDLDSTVVVTYPQKKQGGEDLTYLRLRPNSSSRLS